MRHMGYPTIEGKAFFSTEFAKSIGSKRTIQVARTYAKRLGFPVVVKPNSGSQGSGVQVVENDKELVRALRTIFKKDRVALVQKRISGRDYRIVVLDKKVISAYERIPLNVVGDGQSTIRQLMMRKQKEFVATKRDTKIKFNDPRIALKLRRQKLSLRSIPKKGDTVFLLDNANLSSGGDSIDVTGRIHADIRKMAVTLTHDMGLRLCGVDIMVSDATKKPRHLHILEINAAPGLDHYVKSGEAQERIVEALYLEVLKRMEK
jgi:D-alanine-D-alanine ligase-like ATP-grasp enzyme